MAPDATGLFRKAKRALWLCLGAGLLNVLVWFAWIEAKSGRTLFMVTFSLLALAQFVLAVTAVVQAVRARRLASRGGVGLASLGVFGALVTLAGWGFGGLVGLLAGGGIGFGGAWGRPLRARGRQIHPELRLGTDWTRGERPDATEVSPATRAALEALWLHDAQKEHASVPAFARISWMLAAVGAPPELLRGASRAAVEEIDHAERCFALAAGYGGRTHTVEPMPDLLLGGESSLFGAVRDPLGTLVYESVTDGCMLEDFNADVAALCAAACRAPVTRAVLEQIAREERDHAEFSWQVVAWVMAHAPDHARPALDRAVTALDAYPRPTAVSDEKRALVDRADPAELRAHGRLPDTEWAAAWTTRLRATRARLAELRSGRGVDTGSSLSVRSPSTSASSAAARPSP
jgi:hypothetical protein